MNSGELSSVVGVYPIFNSSVENRRKHVPLYCPGARAGRGGGDEETRTPDPLLAKEMLFQLSYVPLPASLQGAVDGGRFWTRTRDLCLIRAVL